MSANYLRLGAGALILLLILASTAFADRMTFEVKGEGGNVQGAYWIVAEGDIVEDTAEDLEKYLKENKDYTGSWEVRLHSHGGTKFTALSAGQRTSSPGRPAVLSPLSPP